jgi:hypothetical protein
MPDRTDCWKTITSCSTIRDIQEPTIVILVDVIQGPKRPEVQVKMRRNMPFGQLIAWLRTKFEQTEHHQLRSIIIQARSPFKWRIIFESDTPALVCLSLLNISHSYTYDSRVQLGLEDRTTIKFMTPDGIEAVDMTTL